MPKFMDLTGQHFSRLTVLSQADHIGKNVAWNCVCSCGKATVAKTGSLRGGDTKSCGCLDHDRLVERNTKHGLSRTSEYKSWAQIIQRCTNPNNPDFYLYGGRGIQVCERWRDAANFCADMGKKPDGSSIDRIDVNGNYSPENCRWANSVEQANNKRSNHSLTFNGFTKSTTEWARDVGLTREALKTRLERGWSIEMALTTPRTDVGQHRSGIRVGVRGSKVMASPLQELAE